MIGYSHVKDIGVNQFQWYIVNDCGWVPVDEKDLPLTLPEIDDF